MSISIFSYNRKYDHNCVHIYDVNSHNFLCIPLKLCWRFTINMEQLSTTDILYFALGLLWGVNNYDRVKAEREPKSS